MYKRRKAIGTHACLCTHSWMFPTLMHSNFSFLFATCVWPGTMTTGGLGKQRFSKIPMTTQHESLPSFILAARQSQCRGSRGVAWRGRSEVAMAKEGEGHAPPFPLAFRLSLSGRTPALSEGQSIGIAGPTTYLMLWEIWPFWAIQINTRKWCFISSKRIYKL